VSRPVQVVDIVRERKVIVGGGIRLAQMNTGEFAFDRRRSFAYFATGNRCPDGKGSANRSVVNAFMARPPRRTLESFL